LLLSTNTFTWPVPVPRRGSYQLYATWSTAADRATDATYQIHASSPGTVNITVDQTKPNNGWRYLGNYTFDPADANVIVLSSSLTGAVSADAIRVVGTGNAAGVSFILTDQLGQPQKLTDASKAVVWDRVATPYGETIRIAVKHRSTRYRKRWRNRLLEISRPFHRLRSHCPGQLFQSHRLNKLVEDIHILIISKRRRFECCINDHAAFKCRPWDHGNKVGLCGILFMPHT
jgi:hypothetical protein